MLKLTQSVSAKGATRYFDELGPRETIEMLPLRRFEEQLRVRLATRYPDLSADQSKRLHERVAQAVERQKGRLGERVKHSLGEARSELRRASGGQQREFYER
jgi:hypothetical protein